MANRGPDRSRGGTLRKDWNRTLDLCQVEYGTAIGRIWMESHTVKKRISKYTGWDSNTKLQGWERLCIKLQWKYRCQRYDRKLFKQFRACVGYNSVDTTNADDCKQPESIAGISNERQLNCSLSVSTSSHSLMSELDVHPCFSNITFINCSKLYISKCLRLSLGINSELGFISDMNSKCVWFG